MDMAFWGQARTHKPQPMQRFKSTEDFCVFTDTRTASTWQRFTQLPHPLHAAVSATA
jgi:hypothetical protein